MPRIKMIADKADVPADQHDEYDAIVEVLHGVRGPFSVLMHSPGLAQKVMEAGAQVRLGSTLTQTERELAVIAVAREKDAGYEWAAHVRAGRAAGLRAGRQHARGQRCHPRLRLQRIAGRDHPPRLVERQCVHREQSDAAMPAMGRIETATQ